MNILLLAISLLFAGGIVTCLYFLDKNKKNIVSNENVEIKGRFKTIKKLFINKDYKSLILILLCVLLTIFYFFRLFSIDEFRNVSIAEGSELFNNGQIVFMTILRYFTQALVAILLVVGYFKIRTLNFIAGIYGTVITLLNLIFFRWNLIAFEGTGFSFFSWRAIEFAIELTISLMICGILLYDKIKNKDFNKKDIYCGLVGFAILLGMGVLMMDPFTVHNLFTPTLEEADGFNLTHRMCLYSILISGLILHFSIRKRSDDIKHATCLIISIGGIVAFFITYTFVIPLTALPLHLCNAALIIGLFAFIFKSKKLFYFTYFVNVLGALFALLMPNTTGSILTGWNIRFWTTHISVVLCPILAVAWGVFPRPNLKMMKNSIVVFSLYFVVACISNMVISNYEPSVNYFFLQDDFFIGKFPFAYPLRANFAYTFHLWGLELTVWPVYWAIIFVVYIGTMFAMWLIYAYLYKVSDNFAKIKELNKIDSLKISKFKKEILKGKGLKNPIKGLEKVVEIKNFTKVYGNSKVAAVDDFSLTVKKGEVFGFLGHNGAGKSTLIKSMVGIQSITSGSITICGYDIEHQPLEAKLNIGYVSDNHAVYEKLTGREYINFVADLYLVSKEDRDKRLEEYAKLFNLQNDIDRQIKGYSHGMKQKLVVIASIIHNPKVWILDEPLTGLDPMSAHQIKQLMRKMADEGHIVFFSSHVIEVVEKICDKIAIITKGKLKGVYVLDELEKDNISLEKLYLDMQQNVVNEELENKDKGKNV